MAKILVVDDRKNTLEVLNALLEDKYDVTTCDSGCKALEIIKKNNFDVALLDIVLGDLSGYDVLRRLKEINIETQIVMISGHRDKDFILEAGKLGAEEYLVKPFDSNELLRLIENLLNRKILKKRPAYSAMNSKITERERQIIKLLCNGKTNKEIANMTNTTERTVKNHMQKIFIKLEVRNRTEVVSKIYS